MSPVAHQRAVRKPLQNPVNELLFNLAYKKDTVDSELKVLQERLKEKEQQLKERKSSSSSGASSSSAEQTPPTRCKRKMDSDELDNSRKHARITASDESRADDSESSAENLVRLQVQEEAANDDPCIEYDMAELDEDLVGDGLTSRENL